MRNLSSKEVIKMIKRSKNVYVGCSLTQNDVKYLKVSKSEAILAIIEESKSQGTEGFFIASEEQGTVWLG